jgi:hypothetical protein
MKAHIIENGFVVNTIEVLSLDFLPNLIPGDVGGIGWEWDGENLIDRVTPTPEQISATLAAEARKQRAKILTDEIDTMNPMRWAALSAAKKTEWIAYRQALLDVPAQEGFPLTINWPTTPTA